MTQAITLKDGGAALMEKVLLGGDLSKLTSAERLSFYKATCESLGLNPLTKPFDYITLSGKLTLYARKDCTEQLRKIHGVSVIKLEREVTEGVYTVTAYLEDSSGRKDSSIGAVNIEGLKGEARANAIMKSETKAKRRGTLSICGLGILDETEIETIPDAKPFVEPPSGGVFSGAPIGTKATKPENLENTLARSCALEEIKLAFKSAGLDKEENKGVRFGTMQACFGTKKWSEVEALDLNSLQDCLIVLKDRLGIKRSDTASPFSENQDADTPIPGSSSSQEAF